MRVNLCTCDVESYYLLGFDVDHAALILEETLDSQKPVARDRDAVLLEGVGREDDIGDPGLVFEG